MTVKQKGFTLIELVIIIVILGILAAIAIPKYLDMTRESADATARGVLGGLRSANSMVFAERLTKGTTETYTMNVVVPNAVIQGVQYTYDATNFTLTAGGAVYTFTINPTVQAAPTTLGAFTAGGTMATW